MNPIIILQFIVWRHNQHELAEVKKWAGNNGADSVQFKTAQVSYNKDIASLIPSIEKFSRYQKNSSGNYKLKSSIPNECWKMWHSSVMTWDGNIVPCCFDKDSEFKMGNIKNESLRSIWKNDKYKRFRQGILSDRKKNEMCLNCTEGLKIRARKASIIDNK
jgi:radical SAM protein with 4Fe4S-binding SPASM domain